MSTNPLIVSLRDQPRRDGSLTQKDILWTVPKGWSTNVLTLPEGEEVPLHVDITSVSEGVYVQVTGEVALKGQCVRCLEPLSVESEIYGAELYSQANSRHRRVESTDDIEVTGDQLDAEYLIENDTVNLEPLLRDAIFADAPLQPLCSEDCQGICEHCGILLKDAEPGHSHEFLDPRFSALAGLFADETETNKTTGAQ